MMQRGESHGKCMQNPIGARMQSWAEYMISSRGRAADGAG